MRVSLVALVVAVAAAMLPSPVRTQDLQKVDPNRRAGVYAQANGRVIELTVYAEVVNDAGGPVMAAAPGQIIAGTASTFGTHRAHVVFDGVPHLPDFSTFLVNMPGPEAEGILQGASMAFLVGQPVSGRPAPREHAMTCKVRREGVALYRIISPQLDASWLRKTYQRDSSQRMELDAPAFLALMVPGNVGLAPRVYSVQVFPK